MYIRIPIRLNKETTNADMAALKSQGVTISHDGFAVFAECGDLLEQRIVQNCNEIKDYYYEQNEDCKGY